MKFIECLKKEGKYVDSHKNSLWVFRYPNKVLLNRNELGVHSLMNLLHEEIDDWEDYFEPKTLSDKILHGFEGHTKESFLCVSDVKETMCKFRKELIILLTSTDWEYTDTNITKLFIKYFGEELLK